MLKYSTKYVREWAVGYTNCIHNVDFSVQRWVDKEGEANDWFNDEASKEH
jgi:hypothetical protein